MGDENGKDIHPELLKAQKAAEYIQHFGYDDQGGKSADLLTKQITDGLFGSADDQREALEKIEEQKRQWVNNEKGAGTAGAILSRLLALGVIDEFPIGEREIIDIHNFKERGAWILGHLKSQIDRTDESEEIATANNFIQKHYNYAFIGRYAGDFCAYAIINSHKMPLIELIQKKLEGFVYAKIGVKERSKNKGLEDDLVAHIEKWAKENNRLGVWMEYLANDNSFAEMLQKHGYHEQGVYMDKNRKGFIISSKRF